MNINNKHGSRKTGQISNGSKVLLKLCTLTCNLKPFTLGKGFKGSVSGHFINGRHLLYSLPDGGEVGKHTTWPTFCNVRHVDGFHLFSYNIFRLLLGGNEEDFASALSNLLHGISSLIQFHLGFVEVDDMDPVLLHKYIRRHGRVPLSLQVTEMHTCIQ